MGDTGSTIRKSSTLSVRSRPSESSAAGFYGIWLQDMTWSGTFSARREWTDCVTAEALADFFARCEAPQACEHAVSSGQDPGDLLKILKHLQ